MSICKALNYFHPVPEIRNRMENTINHQAVDPKFDSFEIDDKCHKTTEIATSGYTQCIRLTEYTYTPYNFTYTFIIKEQGIVNDVLLCIETNEPSGPSGQRPTNIDHVYELIDDVRISMGSLDLETLSYCGNFMKVARFMRNESLVTQSQIERKSSIFELPLVLDFQKIPLYQIEMKIKITIKPKTIKRISLNLILNKVEDWMERNIFRDYQRILEYYSMDLISDFRTYSETNEYEKCTRFLHNLSNSNGNDILIKEIIMDFSNQSNDFLPDDLFFLTIKNTQGYVIFNIDFRTIRKRMKRRYKNESSNIFVYDFDPNGISALVNLNSISGLFSILCEYYIEITTTLNTIVPKMWIITCNMTRVGGGFSGKAITS